MPTPCHSLRLRHWSNKGISSSGLLLINYRKERLVPSSPTFITGTIEVDVYEIHSG